MKKWSIHFCPLDPDCRAVGAPWRLHVSTPWFHWGLALRPGDRFAHRIGERSTWTFFNRREDKP